jgi:hypothetical protein
MRLKKLPALIRGAAALLTSAGIVCAIGTVPASATAVPAFGPSLTWSSGATVPGAATGVANSPWIAGCTSGPGCDATVMWRNASTNAVDSRTSTSTNLSGSWGPTSAVPSALTSAGPTSQTFYDTEGNYGPFVAWKGQGSNQQVWYSENTKGAWTPQTTIPGATTEYAPAAFFPYYLYVMFVTWVGSGGQIYYSYGTPGATSHGVDTFSWTKPAAIPGALTNAAPAVAEITSNVDEGRLYVFWKGTSTGKVWYSWTTDPSTEGGTWAPEASLTNGSPRTSAGPAAYNEAGGGANGSIMVAYKGTGSGIYYESLSSSFTWGSQSRVPGATTGAGPGLGDGLLAATNSSGKIIAYSFH